jgi:hypothetical protein
MAGTLCSKQHTSSINRDHLNIEALSEQQLRRWLWDFRSDEIYNYTRARCSQFWERFFQSRARCRKNRRCLS